MCGIAGIASRHGAPVEAEALARLSALLAHRGPDGFGQWFNAARDVALGHRRLGIIDPGPGGHQPMLAADGRSVIVFNGEIYNFLELRRALQDEGYAFRSESDTEVILAAWQRWGAAMLPRFNGMWALAIYDCDARELFLARDRFGVKPLLYALTPGHLVFASEMRALVRSGLVPAAIDPATARRMLFDPFGIEGSEATLYRGVQRLPAGHSMRFKDGAVRCERWWRTIDHLPQVPADEAQRAERFGELFRDAVALRMRSDVPIGTCLSGGFDSAAVLCTMSELERQGMGPRAAQAWRHAFVAAFPGLPNDERPLAEEAAAWAGVVPTILDIGRDDALADLERVLDDLDDVYISLPTAPWLLYRQLRRQHVMVSLDGHGADEMMGGYRQQGQALAFLLRNLAAGALSHAPSLARGADLARALMLRRADRFFLRSGPFVLPPALALAGERDPLPRHWGALNRRLYRMVHGTVLPTILRNFDRLSMAHGIEVRMPFLDWRLVAYTMALPDRSKSAGEWSKLVARRAMAGHMPESIRMGRRKVGFNSPMPEWLNGPLARWTEALLARPDPAFDELVDTARLQRVVAGLGARRAWDWEAVGRIWPYIHLKWLLAHPGGAGTGA